ncbi:MAG: DNA replication/repair protein RecF [Bacillota bacterium]
MIIKKLNLYNFLSYKNKSVEFYEGLNVIKGKNASGKTNLIEAIYYASIGKTARNTKDKELITWGAKDELRLAVEIKKRFSSHKIEIVINNAGSKYILIDSLPVSRVGELMGALNVVFFSPDEIKLIKESPVDRRRFLDISLSQQSKTYFYTLLKYNKLLQQRNKLLKEYKNKSSLNDMLAVVEKSLLPCVEFIVTRRKQFVEKLRPYAKKQHRIITGEKEELEISYETEDLDFSDIKTSMQNVYKSSLQKDKKLEYTTKGIHRDDLKIVSGGIDVRRYGSQGQQRTAVLSLKLAEIFMLKETTGEYPVLLLDDVLSELDIHRQKALLTAIKSVQTILTCTEFDKGLVDYKYMEMDINNQKTYMTEKKDAKQQ